MNPKNEVTGVDGTGHKKTVRKPEHRHGNTVANRARETASSKRFHAKQAKNA